MRAPHRWLTIASLGLSILSGWSQVPSVAYEFNGVRWLGSQPRVTLYVSTSLDGTVPHPALGTFDDAITAAIAAADEWNRAGSSNLRFHFLGTTDVAEPADDGINAIIFKDEECPFSCFANTFLHGDYYGGDAVFHGFDIILYGRGASNTSRVWTTYEYMFGNDLDVQSVLLHELGHAVGLAHSNNLYAAMNIYCTLGCRRWKIGADDATGLEALYGAVNTAGLATSHITANPGEVITVSASFPESRRRDLYYVWSTTGMAGYPLRNGDVRDSRVFPIDMPWADAEPLLNVEMPVRLDRSGATTVELTVPENANNLYLAAYTVRSDFLNDRGEISDAMHIRVGQVEPGDVDNTGDVDLLDWKAIERCIGGPDEWIAPTRCVPAGFMDADTDGDGDVDLADAAFVQVQFGGGL